ncbi:tumor necrosis factor receptor superfamily member 23 [Scleropages formosus]|uniref:tumor necrosis factor receptor superfamily member 23 n=1 Tax=Scleropages formosus TaxID=113540 RepID=UPI0008787E73|nr:CD27 antigen [Scleropages formosus]
MKFPWRVPLLSLSLFSLFSFGRALKCDAETQYAWPNNAPSLCCKKCEPGERMEKRCTSPSAETRCKKCGQGYYSDSANTDQGCKQCYDCSMKYMAYVKNCTATSNSVCGCQQGYRCHSMPCVNCVPEHAATEATERSYLPPSQNESNNEVKVLLTLCVVCVCTSVLLICITFASRRHLAKWKTKGLTVFWFSKDTTEEDAQTPIQEECGESEKCDPSDC